MFANPEPRTPNPEPRSKPAFRPDINGLRAWAAIAVLLFHFKLLHFSGGFAGVDVFFVISGYLMAAILYPQMRDFPRQLPGFYVKRLKRVFPALFVLLAILLLLLPHLLIPSDLQVAAKEVKYAALFWYNNKFSLSGYFDVAADERWLLHTWTLGLEFQFYLIFPFLLWVAYKIGKSRRKTALLLLALAVILFAAMLWQGGRNHDKAFFLLPYRMWEFLIGSVLFLWDDEQTKVRRPLVYAGWAALLAFLLLVDEGATWPDMRTLWPVLATAAILYFGRGNPLSNNYPAQKLGTASYSIYLWHWPVYVGMVLFGRATQPLDLWLGAGVSLLLGLLSWYAVENKLTAQINRLSGSLKQAGVLFVGILAVCGVARLVETEKIAAPNTEWQSLEQNILLEAGHPVETEECVNQGKYCYIGDKAMPPSVIFVGDSHATSMYAGLSMLASKYHRSALLVANSSCPTITGLKPLNKDDSIQSCPKSNQLFLETLQRYPNAKVVILNRYNAYIVGSTLGGQWRPFYYLGDKPDENDPVSVEKLKSDLAQGMLSTACQVAKTHTTYWLRPIPELDKDTRRETAYNLYIKDQYNDIGIPVRQHLNRSRMIYGLQDQAAQQCGVHVLDLNDGTLCQNGRCYGVKNQELYYFDDNHLNSKGSRLVASKLEMLFQ